ncbi:hypothetical protein LVJ94_29665 [Pendulispora rubella]|uniref:Uncharacterized protein n=1 Tax=Pendulispora rubella TaxID=2741070 RepID=A0ABZ2KVQ1_9BACT
MGSARYVPSLLLALSGCGGAKPPPAIPGDAAPIPYTAEQIRDACPPGSTRIFRIEEVGQPVLRNIIRFVAATPEEAEIEIAVTDESGLEAEPTKRERVPWEKLRQHAAFPRARTTITDETVATPAGTFAVKMYVVQGDGDQVKRFAFAKSLPGPPVMYATDKGGIRVMTSTLVSTESRR